MKKDNELKFVVRDKEAGNEIEEVTSMEEGLKLIESFEAMDKTDGIYEENFYECVEK